MENNAMIVADIKELMLSCNKLELEGLRFFIDRRIDVLKQREELVKKLKK